MNPNEIFEYITEGIKWLAVDEVSTYLTVMLSNPISMLFSKRIRNQEELDKVIEKESSRLGLKGIKGVLKEKDEGLAYIDNYQNLVIEVGGAVQIEVVYGMNYTIILKKISQVLDRQIIGLKLDIGW